MFVLSNSNSLNLFLSLSSCRSLCVCSSSPRSHRDFRLKNVASINASGHKFGLVYPGLGWVMWRSRSMLPDSLVFHVSCRFTSAGLLLATPCLSASGCADCNKLILAQSLRVPCNQCLGQDRTGQVRSGWPAKC